MPSMFFPHAAATVAAASTTDSSDWLGRLLFKVGHEGVAEILQDSSTELVVQCRWRQQQQAPLQALDWAEAMLRWASQETLLQAAKFNAVTLTYFF